MTARLREAMDDVRRSVTVFAARAHDAHAARIWLPLGHGSGESYCDAEFGISRAQAHRLLDFANRALRRLSQAGLTRGTDRSTKAPHEAPYKALYEASTHLRSRGGEPT